MILKDAIIMACFNNDAEVSMEDMDAALVMTQNAALDTPDEFLAACLSLGICGTELLEEIKEICEQ